MAYFRVCEICGANLDPGEKCTCEQERKEAKEQQIINKQVNAFLQIMRCGNGSIKTEKSRAEKTL